MDYKQIGYRIRVERKKLNLTREKFAEIVDLSINYLGQIERGEKKFSVETIVKIANSLHIPLDYLIFGDSDADCQAQQNEILNLTKRCSKNELVLIADVIKAMLPHLKIKQH